MEKKLNLLTIIYFLFLLLLIIVGAVKGEGSLFVYYLGYALLILFGFLQAERKETAGVRPFSMSKKDAEFLLPLLMPTVGAVMLLSFVTSSVLQAFGLALPSVNIGDSLGLALVWHAAIPAIFEEMLFRFLPLLLIAPYSRRGAIIASAFFFSLSHHDLFSIPYAFFAGALFMMVDLATDSLLPSVIIHFVNNALSVVILFFKQSPSVSVAVYAVVGILSLVSFVFLVLRRERYRKTAIYVLEKGERLRLTTAMVAFALLSVALSIVSL
jgi:membrane protease YdiL (CAAX protease family)